MEFSRGIKGAGDIYWEECFWGSFASQIETRDFRGAGYNAWIGLMLR